MKKIKINAVGCALVDYLYADVSFSSSEFAEYISRTPGDGGIITGGLVFAADLEKKSGQKIETILHAITSGTRWTSRNAGGPALVAALHAGQILPKDIYSCCFYGARGNDESGTFISELVSPWLDLRGYTPVEGVTPHTLVLSDPRAAQGHGERSFINTIGAAGNFTTTSLCDDFFSADICLFGGTALLPALHASLGSLVKRARKNGALTMVNTVYDFVNEKNGRLPWPLGTDCDALAWTDILAVDYEEALKISGKSTAEDAAENFLGRGAKLVIITNGKNEITAASTGEICAFSGIRRYPVSEYIGNLLKDQPHLRGDTTGCGDNFAGGILAACARELQSGKTPDAFSLETILCEAVSAGAFACMCLGGVYAEKKAGEKNIQLQKIRDEWINQIRNIRHENTTKK